MASKFHQRFNIEVGIDEARRRFVNRAHSLVFESFFYQKYDRDDRETLKRLVVAALGDRYNDGPP